MKKFLSLCLALILLLSLAFSFAGCGGETAIMDENGNIIAVASKNVYKKEVGIHDLEVNCNGEIVDARLWVQIEYKNGEKIKHLSLAFQTSVEDGTYLYHSYGATDKDKCWKESTDNAVLEKPVSFPKPEYAPKGKTTIGDWTVYTNFDKVDTSCMVKIKRGDKSNGNILYASILPDADCLYIGTPMPLTEHFSVVKNPDTGEWEQK